MIMTIKRMAYRAWPVAVLLATLWIVTANAAPTKVGNGDDGTDLEGVSPVASGPIEGSRRKAVELLRRLDVGAISGMGILIPEVEKTALFLAKQDVSPQLSEDQGAFHSDMRGLIFARTFAQPHAATRFFPIATRLDETQLIALHVHEGLHRALPPEIRENEQIVSSITLSITGPGATHDQVRQVVARHVEQEEVPTRNVALAATAGPAGMAQADAYPIPESARIRKPSIVGYTYKAFQSPRGESRLPVRGMHSIRSELYAFGSDRHPLGLGIEASLIEMDQGLVSGPLGLSGRMRLWSARGFDVGAWGQASLNTLSDEELKDSPIGRDTVTLGLSLEKEFGLAFVENRLGYTLSGSAQEKLGPYDFTYDYGDVITAGLRAGASVWGFRAGGFAEINLADDYRISGPGYDESMGRYRVISAGPEFSWASGNLGASLSGRFMLNATKNANYDHLGNLMGQGVGQGNIAGSVSLFF